MHTSRKEKRVGAVAESPQGYESLARAGASGLVEGWDRGFTGLAAVGTKAYLLAMTLLTWQPSPFSPKDQQGKALGSTPWDSIFRCRN